MVLFIRLLLATFYVAAGAYAGVYAADPAISVFGIVIAVLGALRFFSIGSSLQYRQCLPKGDYVEFRFTTETLEGGEESLKHYEKLLKRAIQIRNCKKNGDVEAFDQAVKEAEMVDTMMELKKEES